jgi:hypothetical protein
VRRVRRRGRAIILLAAAAAGSSCAPAQAAGNGSPLVLRASSGGIHLRIFNEFSYLGVVLNDACVERTPRITVSARPNSSTATAIHAKLGAAWTSTLVPQAPQFAGAPILVPQGGSLAVDPTRVFERFTSGGGLSGQVPVGFGVGAGIVWIAAYRDVEFSGAKLQQYSNAVAIPTLVTRSGSTCPDGRSITISSGRVSTGPVDE